MSSRAGFFAIILAFVLASQAAEPVYFVSVRSQIQSLLAIKPAFQTEHPAGDNKTSYKLEFHLQREGKQWKITDIAGGQITDQDSTLPRYPESLNWNELSTDDLLSPHPLRIGHRFPVNLFIRFTMEGIGSKTFLGAVDGPPDTLDFSGDIQPVSGEQEELFSFTGRDLPKIFLQVSGRRIFHSHQVNEVTGQIEMHYPTRTETPEGIVGFMHSMNSQFSIRIEKEKRN